MNVQANNNGGPSGGNRKYPNERGCEADMCKGLYDPEIFSDMSFDTLRGYNNRHASLLVSNFTVACYAVMAPKGELIKIMKQVDRDAPNLKPNPFRPNETPLQLEGSHYEKLVVERHTKQRNQYMDDLALQVSNAAMASK